MEGHGIYRIYSTELYNLSPLLLDTFYNPYDWMYFIVSIIGRIL